MKHRIVVAAGGTGGHIFPAQALKEALLQSKDYDVKFITDSRGSAFINKDNAGHCLIIPTLRIRIRDIISFPLEINKFVFSIFKIVKMFISDKPSIVIGFGGYASFPTLLAAVLCGVPILIHESNSVMGRTNRWFIAFAKAAMVAFSNVAHVPNIFAKKLILTGTPVRKCISNFAVKKNKADVHVFNILVIGGSQGAKIISESVPAAIKSLPKEIRDKVNVWQQVRIEQKELAEKLYKGSIKNYCVSTFFSDDINEKNNIAELMFKADLVIARAGASTISEIETLGKPSILIPFASAKDNHQAYNADSLVKNGASIIISEGPDIVDKLTYTLNKLITNPDLIQKMGNKAKNDLHLNSVKNIIKVIKKYSSI